MKSRFILYLLSILVVTSCSTSTKQTPVEEKIVPEHHMLQNEFNEKQTVKAMAKGRNTISGEAFLRKADGNVVTCAGLEALLVPETSYSQERMNIIYGSTVSGYNQASRCVCFTPDYEQYYATQGRTICSSTGHFEFKNIKDGTYFVVALVSWGNTDCSKRQGGALMEKVTVKGGVKREIILTHSL